MREMSYETFCELAADSPSVPVYRRTIADTWTPVHVYLTLAASRAGTHSFLLESAAGPEKIGRYSFIGFGPYGGVRHGAGEAANPQFLQQVRAEMATRKAAHLSGLPRFTGGAVGYIAYDCAALFEQLTFEAQDEDGRPLAVIDYYDRILAFDHLSDELVLMANVPVSGNQQTDREAFIEALAELRQIEEEIRAGTPCRPEPVGDLGEPQSRTARADFEAAVAEAKEHIFAGDAFQIVLSQRFTLETAAEPFTIYRALRSINPSPYLFYLDLGEFCVLGSSPELLVRVDDGQVEVRPIAGTRRRGCDEAEDQRLAEELLADAKEQAEHAMLVDLGRNDLGRVCRFDSIELPELTQVERYSHVMHIVSSVRGQLAPENGALEALTCCFPAGTVSGAPKIRAMEIIDRLEPVRRGIYAGAVGYFDFAGNMDTCIAIRTIVHQGRRASYQAGAGIVADSDPSFEFEETLSKSRALLEAIRMAERGLR